jgi:hypothetical protein
MLISRSSREGTLHLLSVGCDNSLPFLTFNVELLSYVVVACLNGSGSVYIADLIWVGWI